ncbi:O-antigen ligase family protein [Hoeflea poritis]|uniref:O-antigen ligase family protein n=1 Tax=Hoeflea poritis TaxID=2993659 RepID=A0ABT4VPC1_9HYPH|nr:O-antigen ligase family protein [Hoeflea poritis]MDA4846565.1 O-antigen ligase family protein [Hoeflea poritis]
MAEPTGVFSRLFWVHFHRSDVSASLRWAIGLFALFLLFPGIGSGGSVVAVGFWFVALFYFAFDPQNRSFDTVEKPVIAAFAAYYLIMVFFAVLNAIPAGTWEHFGAVYGNILFLAFAPVMPVLRRFVRPYWTNVFFAGTASGAILAALIVLIAGQSSHEHMRSAFSGNPLILALGTMVSGLLCIHGLLFFRGAMRWLLAAGALAALFALLSAGSRGPLLSYMITLFAYALVMGYRHFGLVFMAKRGLLAAMAVGALSFGVIKADPELTHRIELAIERVERPTDSGLEEESISIRILLYKAGLAAFMERPLTGWGRQDVVRAAIAKDPENARFFTYSHLHNGYLTDLVASGVLGLLSLLAVLFVPLMVLRNAPPLVFGGIFCVTISYALYGVTNLLFYHDVSTLYYLSLITAFCTLSRLPDANLQAGRDR